MNKNNLLILLLTTLLLGACQKKEEKRQPPNIIVFLVDDMGWQDTSVPFWTETTPFNKQYRTPNMERMAREGMKFTQAYATPVCSPTRVSLMTGMNAARHRVTNWTLKKDENQWMETAHEELSFPNWNVNGLSPDKGVQRAIYATPLPQLLQDAGYYTIHSGKAHLGAIDTPGENPINLGFDVNIAGHAAGAPQSYLGIENFGNGKEGKEIWAVPGLESYHGKDIFLTEALTLESIKAMDSAVDKKEPFFLYMAHYAVHTPIMADDRFLQKYLEKGLDTIEAKYASMVEGMDKSLGDIMDYLDRKKLADNTIILFMSDNGGLSAVARGGEKHTHNWPLSSGKGSIYEGGIREPMLVKWPGKVRAGSESDQYLIIEDFFPTILEMAGITGIETVQTVDGLSFMGSLTNENKSVNERPLFWHYPNEWGPSGPGIGAFSAVRQGDWKFIYFHGDRRIELYNITQDIYEANNVVDKYPKQASQLATILSNFLVSVDAQMPKDKLTGELIPMSNKL